MQSRPEYSVSLTNQTLQNVFVNTSNASVMNVSCLLSVQSVRQLQQHKIEVSFEITGLPYQ